MSRVLIFWFSLIGVILLSISILLVTGRVSLDTNFGPEKESLTTFAKNFTKVSIDIKSNVIIVPGNEDKVLIRGGERLLNQVQINTTSKSIIITKNESWGIDFGWIDGNDRLDIIINIKNLNELELKNNSRTRVLNFTTETFDIKTFDNSQLIIKDLNTTDLNIENSSENLISITGSSEKTTIKNLSVGKTNLSKTQSKVVKAEIQSSGGIDVLASEELDAIISGSGNIRHDNQAEVFEQITGTGRVTTLPL